MKILLSIKNYFFYKVLKLNAVSVKEAKIITEYINHFEEPKDYFERSYLQYLCQKKQYEDARTYNFLYTLLNFFSLMALLLLLITPNSVYKILFKPNKIHADAITMFGQVLDDRIPFELKNEYFSIKYLERKGILLSGIEKKFVLSLWKRYPCSVNFVLKNALKIGTYSYAINNTQDIKAIIASCEYSYTSSILTEYCRYKNVEHINIMHGEIIVELTKTFFAFDRFYVWDKYYVDLCTERMRAPREQFVVAVPECLIFDESKSLEKIEYKYYFQDQNEEQIIEVKKILDKLSKNYMVRSHPIYTEYEIVYENFDLTRVEDNSVPIEDSIMEAQNIIAWDSTVLLQAYLNNKNAIIDDVTDQVRYKTSAEAGYIMTNKCEKLSKLI